MLPLRLIRGVRIARDAISSSKSPAPPRIWKPPFVTSSLEKPRPSHEPRWTHPSDRSPGRGSCGFTADVRRVSSS
jgi:hypothetical protein